MRTRIANTGNLERDWQDYGPDHPYQPVLNRRAGFTSIGVRQIPEMQVILKGYTGVKGAGGRAIGPLLHPDGGKDAFVRGPKSRRSNLART